MKTVFQKLNFRILSMRAMSKHKTTGKLLWHWFLEIKFWKMNCISKISEKIYLQKFPTIQYFSCHIAPNFCGQ